MNEAIENGFVSERLRGRCAPAHLPCHDSGVDDVTPVPANVPGDFTVRLGDVMPGWVMEGLEAEFGKYGGVTEAVSGFLSAMQWVEVEVLSSLRLHLEGVFSGEADRHYQRAVEGLRDAAARDWVFDVERRERALEEAVMELWMTRAEYLKDLM